MAGFIIFGIDVESGFNDSLGFTQYGAKLFQELNIPVTWFLTGKVLEKHPDVFRKIEASELIELQAHTYNHILLKTILMRIPEGKCIHGSMDWYMHKGESLEEINRDLERCQIVFQKVLGRKATALTGPWGYYRGLADRPDILEVVSRHGFKILRTFARNEQDGQPVPLAWQPFFYETQGFPDILECMIHDYQDEFYWRTFAQTKREESYVKHLKLVARKVAEENLTWSLCSHDHGCATKEGFKKKARWFRAIVEYAKGLNIRFLSVSQYYRELCLKKLAKLDIVKKYGSYYTAEVFPKVIEFDEVEFLSIEGKGNPFGEKFNAKIDALYLFAYTVKNFSKEGGKDFTLPAPEGLWWVESHKSLWEIPRSQWCWKILLRMPTFITPHIVKKARNEVLKKGNSNLAREIKFEKITEGKCVQAMHIGSYETIHETVMKIRRFIEDNNLVETGFHHQIYLRNPREDTMKKRKVIIRQPVKSR